MRGYLGDPEGTKAVLVGGWLRTGDLGYLVDDHLFMTGRIKDVIIVDGANYHAADLERVIETVPGVRRGGSVAVPTQRGGSERLAVIAETNISPGQVEGEKRAIQAAILAETGISPATVALVPPRSLPKTTSGKLKRAEARRLLEAGQLSELRDGSLQPIQGMTETEELVAEIWRDILGVDEIGSTDDFFELGGTSLQAARVVTEIKRRRGVHLPLSVLATSPTVN
jgi:acyl carrier protein